MWRHRPGRNAISAGVSTRPLPRQLAMNTVPARAACTRPGTPSSESPRSSSGSQKSSSSRRRITSTGLRPASVLRYTRLSRTVRSAPPTSGKVPLPREERVLEVGFAVRPGRQHHDARVGGPVRRQAEQRLDRHVEEVGERAHAALVEHRGQRAPAHQPVLERVAGARRRLRAVRDHPPGAVRRPGDVHRVVVQVDAARRHDAVARAQEAGLSKTSSGGTWPSRTRRCVP